MITITCMTLGCSSSRPNLFKTVITSSLNVYPKNFHKNSFQPSSAFHAQKHSDSLIPAIESPDGDRKRVTNMTPAYNLRVSAFACHYIISVTELINL